MYRTDVYFLSKTIAELFIFVIFPFIAFAIPYYIVGLNPEVERFFTGAGIVIMVVNVATSFGNNHLLRHVIAVSRSYKSLPLLFSGYLISCLAATPQIALNISAPMIIPVLLFGGFFLQNGSSPDWLNWIRYISWLMYGNEALSYNQWHDVEFTNDDCKYLNFNPANFTLPPGLPEEVESFYNKSVEIFESFQKNIACSGNDILEIYNFTTVSTELT